MTTSRIVIDAINESIDHNCIAYVTPESASEFTAVCFALAQRAEDSAEADRCVEYWGADQSDADGSIETWRVHVSRLEVAG